MIDMAPSSGDREIMAVAVRRFLKTGVADPLPHDFPGGDVLEKAKRQRHVLMARLVAEVKRRSEGAPPPPVPAGFDPEGFTRSRVGPMVAGLFPAAERESVLGILTRAVVFLTPGDIEAILAGVPIRTAFDLANCYLGSLGRRGVDDRPATIVGLSEGDRCFVACTYFADGGRFSDFVVHEAAHVFHNWKRSAAGLPCTPRREWLLPIDFAKRETFAYACEALSRIVALGAPRRGREALLAEYAAEFTPTDDRVDPAELIDILAEAVRARNGWKRILARCAPPHTARRPPNRTARSMPPVS